MGFNGALWEKQHLSIIYSDGVGFQNEADAFRPRYDDAL